MQVNFIDLKKQYLSIKPEIDAAIQDVLDQTAFAGGPFVDAFEKNFALAHQSKHCIAVNSGTAALHALLMALEIGPGDEVIVPTNTFFATPQAVSLVGATPVFVDCEEVYYNIDPEKIEKAITNKTKAIFAVHLYGQPAQMSAIKTIADRHGLLLLEDCAQAHLALYEDSPVGNFGLAGCFSFYPGKNLGAYGEGGAIVTNDDKLAAKLKLIRSHGSEQKYYHEMIGHNFRMEGLQGAILNVKLKYLSEWTETRIKNAEIYKNLLRDAEDIITPEVLPDIKHVYHCYVIRTARRNELMKFLNENGIATGIHYPIPCHLQKAYSNMNLRKGSMPVSEKIAEEIISLPMSEQLQEAEIDFICKKILAFFSNKPKSLLTTIE